MHISEDYTSINPLLESESNNVSMQNLTQEAVSTAENPLPFPYQTSCLNKYVCLSVQALAFSTLFPFGNSNVTFRDRNSWVSMADSNYHLLKHSHLDMKRHTYTYPFASHN